jgi:hypothetical protein
MCQAVGVCQQQVDGGARHSPCCRGTAGAHQPRCKLRAALRKHIWIRWIHKHRHPCILANERVSYPGVCVPLCCAGGNPMHDWQHNMQVDAAMRQEQCPS